MTISTSRTRELDIGKICQRAGNLSGTLNEHQQLSEARLSMCKDFLESIVDELQAEGFRARAVEFVYVTLVADQAAYTLDADVMDIIGEGMFIEAGETDLENPDSESPLVMIGRDDWQTYAAKSMTGRPTMFYVHRTTSPPTVKFLPIPDATNLGTVRFQGHRLAADSDDESKTPDLERFFGSYLQYELAHRLAAASSLNMNRVAYFGQIAKGKKELCKNYSAQRTKSQMVIRHNTGWGRRR